jgi:hypothetical protein
VLFVVCILICIVKSIECQLVPCKISRNSGYEKGNRWIVSLVCVRNATICLFIGMQRSLISVHLVPAHITVQASLPTKPSVAPAPA